MKNKIKLIGLFVLVMLFSLSIELQAEEENERCDTCTPNPEMTCSVGTGDPSNPTEFCEERENLTTIPPIGPFE